MNNRTLQYPMYRTKRMNGLDGKLYIYKYFPLKHLLSLLERKKLRVDRVSKWEDPYENFFLKEEFYAYAEYYKKDILVSTEEIIDRTYGQSWTLKEESDAMWRIYSNIKNGIKDSAVRIKVRVDNLFNVVYTDDGCMATTSIGQVQYVNAEKFEEIRSRMSEDASGASNFSEIVNKCLFTKREPFAHEEEVRIIISKSTEKPSDEYIEYNIHDLTIFEEFILDPRLEEKEVCSVIEQIKQYDIPGERIRKSSLYEFIPKRTKL